MAAPVFVQIKSASGSNVVTFDSNNTIHNLLIACVNWSSLTITITSITDTRGNVWRRATNSKGGSVDVGGGYSSEIWYASDCKAGANTVTANFSAGPGDQSIGVLEYSGADLTAPFDKGSFGANSSGTTASTPNLALTRPNQIIIGYVVPNVASTGPGSGYTQRMIDAFSNLYEDRQTTTVGSYTVTGAIASGAAIMSSASFSEPYSKGNPLFLNMDF